MLTHAERIVGCPIDLLIIVSCILLGTEPVLANFAIMSKCVVKTLNRRFYKACTNLTNSGLFASDPGIHERYLACSAY